MTDPSIEAKSAEIEAGMCTPVRSVTKWTPDQFWQFVAGYTGEFEAGAIRDMMRDRGLMLTPQDGGPVTTEQLDVLQFGRPLHERPCGMFTDNSTPAEMAEFLRSCGSDTGDQIAKMLERLSTTATPPAPGAERAADYLKKLHRNLIGWLAARYVSSLEAAQTVASDCDKHIDKSGRLLGEVREAVYALPRAERSTGGSHEA